MKRVAFVSICGLLLFGCSNKDPQPGAPRADAPSTVPSIPAPTTSPRTPLQERVRAALERADEAKKADAALPDRVRKAEIGETTTIVGPGASWPCASSRAALQDLMKWHKAMLDERAPDSVMNGLADALVRTRSIMVKPRERVKILDKGPGLRKVSVIEHEGTYASAYMAVAARGCWVAADAVVR